MKIFQTFSAVVLIRGVAAGSFPMMSPVPKPPFKNETEHTTAKTIVTTITSDYSFYCPEPSKFHHKNVTYTATEPTYLTITNCPCTVTFTQNIKSPGTAIYPTAPPGQPMPPTPPVMSSSTPTPPLPPNKPAPPPSEYSAPISGPPPPPPKATAPYSEPSLPPAIPKSTVPIPEAPPPPPHATAPAPAPEPSPPKVTVQAAGTLPPPPSPEVSVPAPELPPPPPPLIPNDQLFLHLRLPHLRSTLLVLSKLLCLQLLLTRCLEALGLSCWLVLQLWPCDHSWGK